MTGTTLRAGTLAQWFEMLLLLLFLIHATSGVTEYLFGGWRGRADLHMGEKMAASQ